MLYSITNNRQMKTFLTRLFIFELMNMEVHGPCLPQWVIGMTRVCVFELENVIQTQIDTIQPNYKHG